MAVEEIIPTVLPGRSGLPRMFFSQFIEQRAGGLQVGGVGAFSEPAINRCEEDRRLRGARPARAMRGPTSSRNAKFEVPRALLIRDA